jgi:hypothetical protein
VLVINGVRLLLVLGVFSCRCADNTGVSKQKSDAYDVGFASWLLGPVRSSLRPIASCILAPALLP